MGLFDALYDNCEGEIELRAINKDPKQTKRQFFDASDSKGIKGFIQQYINSHNLYFAVATRKGGGSKEHIIHIPALWVDIDCKDISKIEAKEIINSFPLRPSVVVSSGGGFHVYFILKEPAVKADLPVVERHLKALAHAMQGDLGCAEMAHILRPPGTRNHKYQDQPTVEIIQQEPLAYNLDDFDFLPDPPEPHNPRNAPTENNSIARIMECAFMQHCENSAAQLAEPLWYAMVTQLARQTGGPDKIHELSRPYPKYNRKETDEKILHAINDTGPITCSVIRESFQCGKDCGVKSPAALSFKKDNVLPFPNQGGAKEPDAPATKTGLIEIDVAMADKVFQLYKHGMNRGLSTGWPSLDPYYTIKPGEFTVVHGIPSHGKSTWMDCLMINLWKNNGWKFAVCSPENWPIQRHVSFLVEKVLDRPFSRDADFERRMTESELLDGITEVKKSFYFIALEEQQMSIDLILASAKEAVIKHGVRGVVVDPWNELDHKRPSNMTEHEYISRTLSLIRRFARKNQVHFWIVAHPRKQAKENGTYQVPTMYEISGSGTWYDKADNGICIFRDFDSRKVDIYVQKVRFRENGKPGKAVLFYVRETASYCEM